MLRLVCLLFLVQLVTAHTGADQEFTCPLCEKKFEAYVAFSGTTFGARLDFKKLGPIHSPWPVPRCDHCGFVIYQDEYDDDLKKKLKAYVTGKDFAGSWKQHTDYYCLGLILENCEDRSAMNLGDIYLQATWELADDDERYGDYAAKAAACFAEVADPAADGEVTAEEAKDLTNFLIAGYLQVELQRRRGEFAAADKLLKTLGGRDLKRGPEWLEPTLQYQSTLVVNKDKAVHTFADVPQEEKEEEAEKEAVKVE